MRLEVGTCLGFRDDLIVEGEDGENEMSALPYISAHLSLGYMFCPILQVSRFLPFVLLNNKVVGVQYCYVSVKYNEQTV